MERPIIILPSDDAEERLWQVTHEIADLLAGLPWVLIGGQMVALLEREHGGRTGRATRDVDALMDVRALTGAIQEAARRLESIGFGARLTNDGLSYRFVRGDDVVDVLAPENLGPRADLTTSPPGTTLETVGGTQALHRRRDVSIPDGRATAQLRLSPAFIQSLVGYRLSGRGGSRPRRPLAGPSTATVARREAS